MMRGRPLTLGRSSPSAARVNTEPSVMKTRRTSGECSTARTWYEVTNNKGRPHSSSEILSRLKAFTEKLLQFRKKFSPVWATFSEAVKTDDPTPSSIRVLYKKQLFGVSIWAGEKCQFKKILGPSNTATTTKCGSVVLTFTWKGLLATIRKCQDHKITHLETYCIVLDFGGLNMNPRPPHSGQWLSTNTKWMWKRSRLCSFNEKAPDPSTREVCLDKWLLKRQNNSHLDLTPYECVQNGQFFLSTGQTVSQKYLP